LPKHGTDILIVRARKESIQMYLERVSDITGIPLSDLVDTWLKKETKFDYFPDDDGLIEE
jgi:hypothetical protein